MKRLKELYNEILSFIENDKIKEIIKDFITILRNIFMSLIVILLGFIFLPSVEWGWLDRGVMISSISGLISGIIGFLGGIVGIIGTFILFKYQSSYNKSDLNKLNSNIIKGLLIDTVSETDRLIEFMIAIYKYVSKYTSIY